MLRTISILLLFSCVGRAQTIENVNVTFDGEKVTITYDLKYSTANQKFKIALYSSHDNYARPISLLQGDFGDNVVPGTGNRIIWDAKNTLVPEFDADLTLKIKASKVEAPKLIVRPFSVSVYKRGRGLDLSWVGGNPGEKLNIELFNDGVLQKRIAERVENTKQSFSWAIPKRQKGGKNYSIRVSNSDQATELANSQLFRIKPRTPFIVKVLPFFLVGGAAYFLLTIEKPTNEILPGPIKP